MINWDHWLKVADQAVKPWEACALSLEIDPVTMFDDRSGYLDGPGVSRMHGEQPNDTTVMTLVECKRRENLLRRYIYDARYFTPVNSNDGKLKVRLPEFAAWLIEMGITTMAVPLERIAKGPINGAETAKLPSSEPPDKDEVTEAEAKPAAQVTANPIDSNRDAENFHGNSPTNRGRASLITPFVIEAVKAARSYAFPLVHVALRNIALTKKGPFTGEAPADGSFLYINSKNRPDKYSTNALRAQLRRLKSKSCE